VKNQRIGTSSKTQADAAFWKIFLKGFGLLPCLGRVFGIIGTPGIGIVEGRDA
jgi:hypothetical protein